jgi:hypothetical protein
MQLICYSIAQWGSTTLSYAGENQRSWFATSLKTLNTSLAVSLHRSTPETGTYLAFQCSHATMRSVGRFTPEYLQRATIHQRWQVASNCPLCSASGAWPLGSPVHRTVRASCQGSAMPEHDSCRAQLGTCASVAACPAARPWWPLAAR